MSYTDSTRLIDLTVKEFKEILPVSQNETREEIISTEELQRRLGVDGEPCPMRSIYNWTHAGMKEAKLGKDRWEWNKVIMFFKDRYGNKKKHIWE
jgi:hypothetical protein